VSAFRSPAFFPSTVAVTSKTIVDVLKSTHGRSILISPKRAPL